MAHDTYVQSFGDRMLTHPNQLDDYLLRPRHIRDASEYEGPGSTYIPPRSPVPNKYSIPLDFPSNEESTFGGLGFVGIGQGAVLGGYDDDLSIAREMAPAAVGFDGTDPNVDPVIELDSTTYPRSWRAVEGCWSFHYDFGYPDWLGDDFTEGLPTRGCIGGKYSF